MRIWLVVVALLGTSGCRGRALKDDYAWAARIAKRDVNRGEDLRFRVETRDRSGQPVEGVRYLWSVDWVGLNGARHRGTSFKDELLRVKGGEGRAFLRIYAYDAGGAVTQVLKEPFEVN